MKLLIPDDTLEEPIDLFLAGGISNCPDWQSDAVELLRGTGLTVANPRRPYGLERTGPEAEKQIIWEQKALKNARHVLFWFPEETLAPITLLELGIELGRGSSITVGAHPKYARRFDLTVQLSLARQKYPALPGYITDTVEETVHTAIMRLGA